jgi:hypothetical protein
MRCNYCRGCGYICGSAGVEEGRLPEGLKRIDKQERFDPEYATEENMNLAGYLGFAVEIQRQDLRRRLPNTSPPI